MMDSFLFNSIGKNDTSVAGTDADLMACVYPAESTRASVTVQRSKRAFNIALLSHPEPHNFNTRTAIKSIHRALDDQEPGNEPRI